QTRARAAPCALETTVLTCAQSSVGVSRRGCGDTGARPAADSNRMALISELRYPTSWYAKIITAFLALIFFALLAMATIGGFLLYGIVSPPHGRSEIDTQSFPGHPEGVSFNPPSGGSREGWFFPGLKTAPTIILCHGYQSTRGDLLTLVSALQDHQYNVF